MQDWLIFGLLALVAWGLWGLFPKLATAHISPSSAVLFNLAGSALVVLVFALSNYLLNPSFHIEFHSQGSAFAMMAGMAGTTGMVLLYFAMSRGGQASVIVPMTALYPVLTAVLALLFLQETITVKQAVGMLFAFTAIVLFSL